MTESTSGGTRRQESDETTQNTTGRDSATSKETLEDLEESENISNSKTESSGDGSDVPSPDGTLDEPGELKDAGPM